MGAPTCEVTIVTGGAGLPNEERDCGAESRERLPEDASAPPSSLFLLHLRDGDLQWQFGGRPYASREAAEADVAQSQRMHGPGFASAYRIEQVAVIAPGEWQPFIGTGPLPEPEAESASEAVEGDIPL